MASAEYLNFLEAGGANDGTGRGRTLVMPRMNMAGETKEILQMHDAEHRCPRVMRENSRPRAVHPTSEGENGSHQTAPSFFAIEIRQSESLIGIDCVGAHLSTPS